MSKIKRIIDAYTVLVKGIEAQANIDDDRAYGGIIRAGKGALVENISQLLVEIAWNELGGEKDRISFIKQTKKLHVNLDYVNKIKNTQVKDHILANIDDYFYTLKADVHCSIDNELVIAVECKAYTENAMMKRILTDFTLMKNGWPNLNCFLLQLESQLGGDYSDINKKTTFGSKSTHTLFSYFDIDIEIITLLEGERKVDKPIHKQQYFKELTEDSLLKTVEIFKKTLKEYL